MKKILLITFSISTLVSNAQVASGLVAHYSFNGANATDDVGTNDGTVSGAVLTTDRFGNANKAYYFDGVDDFIDLGTNATIKPTVGSISLWFNIDAISSTGSGYAYNPIILAKNNVGGSSYFEGYCFYVVMADNRVVPVTTESGTTNEKYIFSAAPFVNDAWQHVVVCYDNDSLWFYSAGNLENVIFKGFSSTFSSTESVRIAHSNDVSNNRYFNGGVDDVRIYNRVLTPLEVDTLFNAVNPTVGINENNLNENSISIFPNPTNSLLNIVSSELTTITIVNVLGQELMNTKVQGASVLDVSTFDTGIYFVKDLNSGKTLKFIKK